jgi:glycosyltransferase involved in cell wall biosynthesis
MAAARVSSEQKPSRGGDGTGAGRTTSARSIGGRRPRVGMALYGDVTYDSRVRKEARTLARAGCDVTIVCLASEGPSPDLPATVNILVVQPPGTSVSRGFSNPFFAPGGSRRAAVAQRIAWLSSYARGLRSWGRLAVAAAGQVDVWHAHDLTGLAAVVPHLGRRSPVVYDSHELFLETGTAVRLPSIARRLLRIYERRLVSRTAAVVTVNDEIAHILDRRYRPRRIEVVHNCPERWSAPVTAPVLIREAAGIPHGAPIVLYHGGLTAGRGIGALMESMLVEGLEDVHLVLMGYGDMRDEFQGVARSERWGGRIHVLDPVPPSVLLSWVASADVGAMPNPGATRNDYFSSPNKLFECFAAGVPVVASDFPTMRRIIIDDPGGPLGAVCDPERTEDIAGAIRSIVRLSPGDRDAFRARCRRAAADRWNWEAEASHLLSIYAEILPRPTTVDA